MTGERVLHQSIDHTITAFFPGHYIDFRCSCGWMKDEFGLVDDVVISNVVRHHLHRPHARWEDPITGEQFDSDFEPLGTYSHRAIEGTD